MKTVTYDETQLQLVPMEPTREMVDAAAFHDDAKEQYKAVYRAMLAAAPQPPAVSAAPTGWDAQFLAVRLGRVAALAGVAMPNMSYEDTADAAGTILGQIAAKLEARKP